MEQQKIIKRLELIKNLISLEEEEEIVSQILKLQTLQLSDEVKSIVTHLQAKAFSKAVVAIETFINNRQQVTFYIDPEIEALRFEAKTLEAQLQQLSDEKAELEKLIHEFSVRHNRELGELILKILQYRKEQHRDTPQEEETKKDYEDFYTNYEATKNEEITKLTEDEEKELKEKYRKASKLCHPDVVAEEQKEAAHKIFTELNAAYERSDLIRVSEILEDLLNGKSFKSKSDTVNEKISLQAELERLRNRLNGLTKEIIKIKTSETFEKITSIKDSDEYFTEIKKQLQEQLSQLENGSK
ncbi:MAG: DnaJ domain-containing protein [Bacteroidetes bacterium]|nr:DnaJ domain-containing protein [Bacteroidota bacterium]